MQASDGPRYRVYLALLTLGAYAQIVQALLIRESLVVFYGNEVSLGAFFGSWLFWAALGSLGVMWLRDRAWLQKPLPLFRVLVLALPWLLALQVIAARLVRLFLDVSSAEFVPLGELFVATLLITLPTSLATGVAFPLGCQILGRFPTEASPSSLEPQGRDVRSRVRIATRRTVKDVSHLYVFDALGALLGGVLFTFVLVEWFGVWRTLGCVALLLAATAASLQRGGTRLRFGVWLTAAIGLALAATPVGRIVHERMEALRFTTLQPGLELLDTVETRYGHVAIARFENQVSVVTDGRIAESFPTPRVAEQEAAYFWSQSNRARRILLFGGLAGGLPEELLRYPVERVEVIEEDRRAFERVRPHLTATTREALQDPRLVLHFEDGRRFTNRLRGNEDYDLVLVLAADPSSARSNRYFTYEFYARMRSALSERGVLCTQVSSASNYLGREVKSYSGSVFRTLSAVFSDVVIAPGDSHVYCASTAQHQVSVDPNELEQRYLDTPLDEHRFPSISFYSLLPADRVGFVRTQLEGEGGELNTDRRPVTYYLNMLLWGKFSASELVDWLEALRRMGPWPYLVPLAVFVVLLIVRAAMEGVMRPRLRRQSATLALVVLGMIAMAAQLSLLFSYQAHVGFMFGRIALLNGMFMTGLALGAGAIGQALARGRYAGLVLAGCMGLVAAWLAVLPTVLGALSGLDSLGQETAYLALAALVGCLTGIGFPLGVHLAHLDAPNVLRSSSLIEAADNLGGALGGLLTGAILVPILGVASTCYLLALMSLIALLPLLYTQLAPASIPMLRRRGHRAFPYPLVSWGLVFAVLTVFALSLIARAGAPEPRVHFDDPTLATVSGSRSFELREQPVPHYLGSDQASAAQDLRDEARTQPPSQTAASLAAPDTVSLASISVATDITGHAGPINLLVAVDNTGVLRGVRHLESHETPSYIEAIDPWLHGLAGHDLSRGPLSLDQVDAMSGATITSRAALATINRAVAAGGREAFGKPFAAEDGDSGASPSAWLAPRFLVTLALLLAFFPVYRSGNEPIRLGYQAAVLLWLGFGLNSLVTEVDLINLSLGRVPSLSASPDWYLLVGFVAVTALLFGQAYCGYVCPFGALQELLSRIGRFLYLRSYAARGLDTRMRHVKFVLLALSLVAVWITGDAVWASFNPMQHFFHGNFAGWIGAITIVTLIGALFYYRFWCRYFCPFGAFLALSNKLALLKRLAPTRRFDHCDLGVHDEYDVDCLHCHRCITAKDFGVRDKKPVIQQPSVDH